MPEPRVDLPSLLTRAEAAAPVGVIDAMAGALAEMLGARDVSFMIADFSGRSLTRLGHTAASGGAGSRTEETVPGYRFDMHSVAHNIINMTTIPRQLDLAGAAEPAVTAHDPHPGLLERAGVAVVVPVVVGLPDPLGRPREALPDARRVDQQLGGGAAPERALPADEVALDPGTIDSTLGVLLKYQDDIARLQGSEAMKLLDAVRAELAENPLG